MGGGEGGYNTAWQTHDSLRRQRQTTTTTTQSKTMFTLLFYAPNTISISSKRTYTDTKQNRSITKNDPLGGHIHMASHAFGNSSRFAINSLSLFCWGQASRTTVRGIFDQFGSSARVFSTRLRCSRFLTHIPLASTPPVHFWSDRGSRFRTHKFLATLVVQALQSPTLDME